MPDYYDELNIQKLSERNFICLINEDTLDKLGVNVFDIASGNCIDAIEDLFQNIIGKITSDFCVENVHGASFSVLPSQNGGIALDVFLKFFNQEKDDAESPVKIHKNRGLYAFDTIRSAMQFCRAITNISVKKSCLIRLGDCYILCVESEEVGRISTIGSEFVSSIPMKHKAYYLEHGTMIIENNAIKNLSI